MIQDLLTQMMKFLMISQFCKCLGLYHLEVLWIIGLIGIINVEDLLSQIGTVTYIGFNLILWMKGSFFAAFKHLSLIMAA